MTSTVKSRDSLMSLLLIHRSPRLQSSLRLIRFTWCKRFSFRKKSTVEVVKKSCVQARLFVKQTLTFQFCTGSRVRPPFQKKHYKRYLVPGLLVDVHRFFRGGWSVRLLNRSQQVPRLNLISLLLFFRESLLESVRCLLREFRFTVFEVKSCKF